MFDAQCIEQRVDAEGLSMHTRPTGRRRRDQITVHVPLHVGDVVISKQGMQVLEQVLAHLRSAEIENELVASHDGWVAIVDERPLGMSAIQVRIRVHHLRLDPYAELHAEATHVIDQRTEPVRPHCRIDPPVTEAGVVAAP